MKIPSCLSKKWWILPLITLIIGCGQNAKDIPITDIENHRNYQDEKMSNKEYSQNLIAEYNQLLSDNPKSAEVYYLLSRIENDNKLQYLKKSLELKPNYYWALNGLANYYSSIDASKSLSYSLKGIDSDNTKPFCYYHAAIAYATLSDKTENLSDKHSYVSKCIDMFKKANEYSGNQFAANQSKTESYLTEVDKAIEKQKETAHIGTWSYSDGYFNYQKKIYQSGSWSSKGISGYSSGTWEGDASDIKFYEQGFMTSRGSVSNDGKTLYLQTSAGNLNLKKVR